MAEETVSAEKVTKSTVDTQSQTGQWEAQKQMAALFPEAKLPYQFTNIRCCFGLQIQINFTLNSCPDLGWACTICSSLGKTGSSAKIQMKMVLKLPAETLFLYRKLHLPEAVCKFSLLVQEVDVSAKAGNQLGNASG